MEGYGAGVYAPNENGNRAAERQRRRADRAERRHVRRKEHALDRYLRESGLSSGNFGGLFVKLRQAFIDEEIEEDRVEKMIQVGSLSVALGLPIEMVKYRRLHRISRQRGANDGDTVELWTQHLRQLKSELTQQNISYTNIPRADRDGEAPVNPDNPPSLIIGNDEASRYNIRITEPWLGPDSTNPMRAAPNGLAGETHIQFNDGERPFPTFLLSMSELIRYNQPDRLVAFDRAAMYQQIPSTLPERYRLAVRSELDRMNSRIKPSAQHAFAQISRTQKTDRDRVHLAHVLAALAFVHYDVHKTGRNNFLYRQFKSLGLKECLKITFPWNDRIQGRHVVGNHGQRLRITTKDPPARRNRNATRFEQSKLGKALKQETVLRYTGLDRDGRMLYEALRDRRPGIEAELANLRQLRMGVMTDRDILAQMGDDAWNNGDQARIPGDMADEEGNAAFD